MKNTTAMKILLVLVVALVLFGSELRADPLVTVTPRQGRHELFDQAGKLLGTYDTAELCAAQITANVKTEGKSEWKCKAVTHFTAEAKCGPAPVEYDEEQYKILKALPEPTLCPNGTEFEITGPVWEARPFPVCGEYVTKVLQACGFVPAEVVDAPPDEPGLNARPDLVGTEPDVTAGPSTWEGWENIPPPLANQPNEATP